VALTQFPKHLDERRANMSEIGIRRVDAAWVSAWQEGVEPYPVSFLVFQGIGDRERAAVVLRAEEERDPILFGALLDKLPIAQIQKYASANAARREIQSALDRFKRDLEALMREAQASKVQIYPGEIGTRGGAITGFFMRREGTVRHQAGGTRVHVMTFGAQPSLEAAVLPNPSQHLHEATRTIQTRRKKGENIYELTLISAGLYGDLLSLRQAQVEAERAAETAYHEIAAQIAQMNRDIQETLRIVCGGRLVGVQDFNLGIVEGIAFSLKQPGAVPSQKDPVAAIFVWETDEKLVYVQETREYLVLRWPRGFATGEQ
jgi:hypothetical protein